MCAHYTQAIIMIICFVVLWVYVFSAIIPCTIHFTVFTCKFVVYVSVHVFLLDGACLFAFVGGWAFFAGVVVADNTFQKYIVAVFSIPRGTGTLLLGGSVVVIIEK